MKDCVKSSWAMLGKVGQMVCLMEDEDEGRQQSRMPPGLRAWHWLDRGADDKTGADSETNWVSFRACACNPSETALE